MVPHILIDSSTVRRSGEARRKPDSLSRATWVRTRTLSWVIQVVELEVRFLAGSPTLGRLTRHLATFGE